MTHFDSIEALFEQNNGILKTSQALEKGVPKPVFYDYVRLRNVEQVAHGVYATDDAWPDSMYLIHLRCAQAVFSHDSALYLHGLTTREPALQCVTVKTGYNPSNLQANGLKVYTIKKSLHSVGLTKVATTFGNLVPVYDPERTICDVIRSRNGIEAQVFQEALKMYASMKGKNLGRLAEYARMFHVEKLLRQYLEVLL